MKNNARLCLGEVLFGRVIQPPHNNTIMTAVKISITTVSRCHIIDQVVF